MSDDLELVRGVLREVLVDATAPAAAKVQAARTLAELIGALGRHQTTPPSSNRAANDMSLEDIDAELDALGAA